MLTPSSFLRNWGKPSQVQSLCAVYLRKVQPGFTVGRVVFVQILWKLLRRGLWAKDISPGGSQAILVCSKGGVCLLPLSFPNGREPRWPWEGGVQRAQLCSPYFLAKLRVCVGGTSNLCLCLGDGFCVGC